ncbi:MAG: HDOD domain-containing protein [Gammaproteobacteria bacterium]|nr:HDOD domain-containing protein [Gammaproteobacteria bacterium]
MADCFIGRQPIINQNNEVYAYELLYRGNLDNKIGDVDRDIATAQVIMNAFVEIGLENIVGSHLAFVNMTEQFLVTPDLMCFPPKQVVLELTDSIPINKEVLSSLDRLKAEGHTVSLNGYRSDAPIARLLPYADVIKLDAIDLDDNRIRAELFKLQKRNLMIVAKRVETTERRKSLADMGIKYFQGYFLSKPTIVSGERLPTNKMAILQLLTKVSDPNIENAELEQLITMDASLSLRVLRFVNSPLSGLARQIDSIHQAVVMVGRNIIKNWVILLTIANLDDSIPELITMAFVRAKLSEKLAAEANLEGKESFFTVGLFSLVDAIMGKPIEELLETLPFTDEIKQALTEQKGVKGEALMCAKELELGAPNGLKFQDLPPARIFELYVEALNWADQASSGMGTVNR